MDTAITIDEDVVFDKLYNKILLSGKQYNILAVTGISGLSIAQKLAYKLDIHTVVSLDFKEVRHITGYFKDETLFLDSMVCSGATIEQEGLKGVDVACLVWRVTSSRKPTYYGMELDGTAKVKFSWEK